MSRAPAPTTHRRLAVTAAVAAVVTGGIFLAGPALSADPTTTGDGVAASVQACHLRVIRAVPMPPPTTDTFTDTSATPAVDGYHLTGTVTSTNTIGAALTLPWTCATEPQGTGWRVWHVAVGNQ